MLDNLTNLARYAAREIRARRNLRELLEKEDRLLHDIGLTRIDVESALYRRFGQAAESEAFHADAKRIPR